MNKKLGIFSLAGLSLFALSGCTIPGVPDPQQVADQTRMLVEMQQQMSNLLSGMNALQEQNNQLSGTLLTLQAYIESQKESTETADENTHGSASLSDPMLFGGTGSSEATLFGSGLIPSDINQDLFTGKVDSGSLITTGSSDSTLSGENKSILEELKKVANKKNGSGEHNTTVNSGNLE